MTTEIISGSEPSPRITFRPPVFEAVLDIFGLLFALAMAAAILYNIHNQIFPSASDYVYLIAPAVFLMWDLNFMTLGDKTVIHGNIVTNTTFFFIKKQIAVTAETSIRMGERKGADKVRMFGWKISNRHGNEKVWIPCYFHSYKRVLQMNSIFEHLIGRKIKYSRAALKF